MATVNERLYDAEVDHAVNLQRVGNGVIARLIALLNRADADLSAKLTQALETAPSGLSVARIDALLASAREINANAYEALSFELDIELRDLVDYEAGYQQQLFTSTLPVQVSVASVVPEQVYTAALSRPFQARLLREWMQGLEIDRAARVRDAVRMGYVENQTVSQIVQRIRGTRALKYNDGILEISRRNAEAVIRTAMGHMSGFTRDRFYSGNSDLIKGVRWVSTLDARTSDACMVRDGKLYAVETHKPIGHKIPWGGGPGALHFNCRSSSVAVIKSFRELGFDIDDLPASTRASLNGQVPDDMAFGDWLKKQSAERQDDVLGPARGKLLRQNNLSIDRFFNDKGVMLTLDQLRARDAKLFATAGV